MKVYMCLNERQNMLCFLHSMLAFASSKKEINNTSFSVRYECVNTNVQYIIKCVNEFDSMICKVMVVENNTLEFSSKNDEIKIKTMLNHFIPAIKQVMDMAFNIKLKQGEDYKWKNVLK